MSLTMAVVVLGITSLGMAVPSSPGYIGVFEYLTVVALGLFGVPHEQALGYALLSHGLNYVGVLALGALGVAEEGLSYARLREIAEDRG